MGKKPLRNSEVVRVLMEEAQKSVHILKTIFRQCWRRADGFVYPVESIGTRSSETEYGRSVSDAKSNFLIPD